MVLWRCKMQIKFFERVKVERELKKLTAKREAAAAGVKAGADAAAGAEAEVAGLSDAEAAREAQLQDDLLVRVPNA